MSIRIISLEGRRFFMLTQYRFIFIQGFLYIFWYSQAAAMVSAASSSADRITTDVCPEVALTINHVQAAFVDKTEKKVRVEHIRPSTVVSGPGIVLKESLPALEAVLKPRVISYASFGKEANPLFMSKDGEYVARRGGIGSAAMRTYLALSSVGYMGISLAGVNIEVKCALLGTLFLLNTALPNGLPTALYSTATGKKIMSTFLGIKSLFSVAPEIFFPNDNAQCLHIKSFGLCGSKIETQFDCSTGKKLSSCLIDQQTPINTMNMPKRDIKCMYSDDGKRSVRLKSAGNQVRIKDNPLGESRTITQNIGHIDQFRLSPDGKKLILVNESRSKVYIYDDLDVFFPTEDQEKCVRRLVALRKEYDVANALLRTNYTVGLKDLLCGESEFEAPKIYETFKTLPQKTREVLSDTLRLSDK